MGGFEKRGYSYQNFGDRVVIPDFELIAGIRYFDNKLQACAPLPMYPNLIGVKIREQLNRPLEYIWKAGVRLATALQQRARSERYLSKRLWGKSREA